VSVRFASRLSLVAACLLHALPGRASEPAAASGPTEPIASVDACPSGDRTACGREQFEIGTRAFEHSDFEAARRAFELALSLRPHPVIRYNVALCWARTGKPSKALLELDRVIADPATDKDLRERSEREHRSAEMAEAHLTFTLSNPQGDYLELDGARVAAGRRELDVDPGAHHVRIISGASVVLDQDLDLAPGERVELRVGERSRRIDVVVVPEARPAQPARRAPLEPARAPRPLGPTWFFVGAGATAALTGLTIWSGIDTQHAFSNYQRELSTLTQSEADARVKEGHSRELRTNLLLSGSILAAAGSALLAVWFVDFGGQPRATVAFGDSQLFVSTRF